MDLENGAAVGKCFPVDLDKGAAHVAVGGFCHCGSMREIAHEI
jgi:hypothetical protein